jgi:hypothetical protein
MMGLFLLSKQVDCLFNEITEFDGCFPESDQLENQVEEEQDEEE